LSKRKLVFVVDDDPSMLRGVRRLLREHGYDTMSFPSANAFRHHGDFGEAICAVLDIDLNDGSGLEVHGYLKRAGIALPVIYITGRDTPATRMAAIEAGCIAYLTKPFVASSLIEAIDQLTGDPA
jgi:FixJ family two-component response regulator